ncbi:helix-turn-helix transcriptional regulator [Nostocaceae cyanobacterium CENA357]|uniref:Helix-turn-helix transcriptional regulator n=1 Tax=Atlanticothrix silvestris CENA357 TaxID=1725252 RepID=A0A8J7L5K7_9CYAN|nr:AraC family transcriptional regulator [Atlanticothrix silvestris]MBH8554777.1 helix-turn-helix transcriptional regulator [Atlanticothrix silvestris CENA357]
MTGTEILNINTNYENAFSQLFSRPPILSSGRTKWSGISLEHLYLPSGETPEYSLEQFVITINLGQSVKIERILDRHLQTGLMFTGAVGLCPMHTSQAIRWDRDVNILLLNLNHELLTCNAIELLDTDEYEMLPHLITQDALIYQIGLGLKAQLKTNGSDSCLYGESAATFLAVHLLQNYSTQKFSIQEYAGGLPLQKLKQVVDYIHDHLAQEISLDAIANYLGMSRYYFCRLFKQSTGLSLHQYVIQQRVEQAKQLLAQGKMSIADIALACGFSHQSHLHRHFKRLTGVTPKNFHNL